MIDVLDLIGDYLSRRDLCRHNANLIYSLPAMAGILSGYVQRRYYLERVLDSEERLLHEEGWWYHHQLHQLSPYCVGFSALDIMRYGLQSLNGFSVKSRPPRHLRTFLDQSANFILKISQEVSGAVALNDLTTVAAALTWFEREVLGKNLTYDDVKNAFQSFVYNVNLDFRSGNSPFTNVTVTIGSPAPALLEEELIIGGRSLGRKFGEIPREYYDEVNEAFFEIMAEGDSEGKPWTFPIITVYVTDDFQWDNPVLDKLLELMDHFGGVYFENYVSKPFLSEEWRERIRSLKPRNPALNRSFCCRFQVDLEELMSVQHTGGLFGRASGVGSIGVITINFNRLGYIYRGDLQGLMDHLELLLERARRVLNKKRSFILKHRELYPTLFFYIRGDLKTMFSTISLGGGHEGLINFGIRNGILSDEGLRIAEKISTAILDKLKEFAEEDGVAWNFEYAPMETAAAYLARRDLEFVDDLRSGLNRFKLFRDLVLEKAGGWGEIPDIYVSGTRERPLLTSGFQPPFSERSLTKLIYVSAHTQNYATGGSVLHLFIGERLTVSQKKKLVRSIFENHPVKYITLTPTLSRCNSCGFKAVGEKLRCPSCGSDDVTIYSRVVGYFRPIARKVLVKDPERGLYEGVENVWQDSRRADWATRGILMLSDLGDEALE
ncbi:MAG: ribonucleoside-triphosphate reductase [Thaumarchaeota archaeon]|nr:MAG: ribonucleoside-triphosphate reductase [Nitrososphaerota archaeon]